MRKAYRPMVGKISHPQPWLKQLLLIMHYNRAQPRNHAFTTLQHRYQRVLAYPCYLNNFEKYLNTHGTRSDKLRKTYEYTFNRFKKAREDEITVPDRD